MKKSIFLLIFAAALMSAAVSANATTPDSTIVNIVTQAIGAAGTAKVLPQAITWLAAFMGLQFILTNLSVLKSGGEIEAVWAKLLGSLLWFGFCVYVMNNGPAFIDQVGTGVIKKFAPDIPGPGAIIDLTLAMCASIVVGITFAGTSIAGIGNSSIAMVLVYVLFIVFFIGMYMAIKVLMLSLELGIIVLLAPLSFSFLGLNALKDQGIAPFKSLIALVYRIILLGIVFSAFKEVIGVSGGIFNGIDWHILRGWNAAISTYFSTLAAFPVLAYLVYKSEEIASTLANGSASMGADGVAQAVAAGMGAHTAANATKSAVSGSAANAGRSMSNLLGQASVSNAGGGRGGVGVLQKMAAPAPAPGPASSLSSAGPGAAQQKYETTKAGAPIRPGGGSNTSSAGTSPGSSGGANSSSENTTSSTSTQSTESKNTENANTRVDEQPQNGMKSEIGGDNLSRAHAAANNQDAPRKPGLLEEYGALNQHVARQGSATHVSVNAHAGD